MRKYPCRYPACTKSYKSTSGRGYHEKHAHGGLYTAPGVSTDMQVKGLSGTGELGKSLEEQKIGQDEIQAIKIQEVEFVMAKNTLKGKESEEKEYGCEKCGAEFDTRHKYCPECGIEFGG